MAITEEMQTYIDAVDFAPLDSEIGHTGQNSLFFPPPPTQDPEASGVSSQLLRVTILLGQRLLVAPADKAPTNAELLLRPLLAAPRQTHIQNRFLYSSLSRAATVIRARRTDLGEDTALILDQLADDLQKGMRTACAAEFRLQREWSLAAVRYHYDSPIFGSFCQRFLRPHIMSVSLATENMLAQPCSGMEAMAQLPLPTYPPNWQVLEQIKGMAYRSMREFIGLGFQTRLELRCTAALLRKKPLPDDEFAIPGTPLKPIIRDQRTIGWYGVGKDGIDNGGSRLRDFCLGLDERLGRNRAGDQPDPEFRDGP
jgi:hypothetical protein